jgi:hypothetical protein
MQDMASKRRLEDQDVAQELILDIDSDEDIFPCVTNTDSDNERDIVQTPHNGLTVPKLNLLYL